MDLGFHVRSDSHALLRYIMSCYITPLYHYRYSVTRFSKCCSFTWKVSTSLKSHYLTYLVTAGRRSFSTIYTVNLERLVRAATPKYDPPWRYRGSFTSEIIHGSMREEVTIILYSLVDAFIAARKVYRRMYLSIYFQLKRIESIAWSSPAFEIDRAYTCERYLRTAERERTYSIAIIRWEVGS